MKRKSKTVNISVLLFGLLVLAFFCIAAKLSLVALSETTDGMNLKEFQNSRNIVKETLKAKRGSILSSDGEVLSQNINSYTVVAVLSPTKTDDEDNPRHVVDKEMTADKLSGVLGIDRDYLLKLLNQDKYQVELGPNGRGITEIMKNQIQALDLPGIEFIETSKRYYTMGNFASYILGYADTTDEGNIVGKMGVEAYYDNILQGKDGYSEYEKDGAGYKIPTSTPIIQEAENGEDIYLTIDSKIQMFVENGINEITSSDDSLEWLTFNVIDAKTGAIVATSSSPSFNPNKRDISVYLNPLTSYTYEPGSTMKIFSFLAAMENGVYDGDELYQSGTIQIDDATIKDFNGRGWGTITYDSGFAYSSNVAATNLALKLGRDNLYNYYAGLGFGQKTGITLPGESAGNIDFRYRTELATASFGQGITTTPIQNLQALTILTNDGIEIQPYIIDKIVNENGEVTYKHERTELGKKASKESVDKMMSLMYDVVYSGKTDAKYYQADNVTLVGKTGTAQYAGSDGKYVAGIYDYVRSFAGVFPYDNPQYIVYVSIKKYTGSYRNFAKMVTKVVEEIAKYKNITDLIEVVDTSKIITLDNFLSTEITYAEENLKLKNINIIRLGNGKYVINQYPEKGQKILSGNKVFLVTNDSEYIMPNIIGWNSSEVVTLCKLLNIRYNITGYGVVTTQSIAEGTLLTEDLKLEVTLD
ncbi:MAG: penicillin-binding protein [Candidatus Coprovivens sp.]